MSGPDEPDRHVATLDDVREVYAAITDRALLSSSVAEVAMEAITCVTFHVRLAQVLMAKMLALAIGEPGVDLASAVLVLTQRLRDTWGLVTEAEKLALQALLSAAAATQAVCIGKPHMEATLRAVRCAADARAAVYFVAAPQVREAERHRVYACAIAVISAHKTTQEGSPQ